MRLLWLAPVHYDIGEDVHPAPWISTLARSLTETHGVSIHIVNYAPRLPRKEISFEKEGVKYTFLKTPAPKWDHLGFFRKRIGIMKKYLLDNRASYDMIHVHGSEHQYEACVTGTGIPHVLSMQGVMGECLKKLSHRFTFTHLSWWMSALYERYYTPRVENFICRTHFDEGFVKQMNPKAVVHHNWEMIRSDFFQDLGTERPFKILYMGGTHPIKGLDLTLQAMDIVRETTSVELMILGKADEDEVAGLIDKLGLHRMPMSAIKILGFQDIEGVVKAMKKSFLLLHTSLIDNSPNSVCEAQVAGLPVVCTNVGGTSSLFETENTGLLATLSPENIAAQVIELIRNPKLHSTLKRESRTMARQRHNPELIARRTVDIYHKVLGDHDDHQTNIQGPQTASL